MGKLVNLVRPDGTAVSVPAEKATLLIGLGYRPEVVEEELDRLKQSGEAKYYEGTGQQVLAGVEGLASGATLGLADLVMDDEATRKRAAYNPGTRLAGELVGGVVPSVLAPGLGTAGKLARATPAGALSKASLGYAERALGEGLASKVVGLGAEGALTGLGGEITRSTLSGDPLTVEQAMSGMTLGAVFGAGAGTLLHGVQRVRAARAARATDHIADQFDELVGHKTISPDVADDFMPRGYAVSDEVQEISPERLRALGVANLGEAGKDAVRLGKAADAVKAGAYEPVSVVRFDDGTYEIVDGRHRFLAAEAAGVKVRARIEKGVQAAPPAATSVPAEHYDGFKRAVSDLYKASDELKKAGDVAVAPVKPMAPAATVGGVGPGASTDLYEAAVDEVVSGQRSGTSWLAKAIGAEPEEAEAIMLRMEAAGIVSPKSASGTRKVLTHKRPPPLNIVTPEAQVAAPASVSPFTREAEDALAKLGPVGSNFLKEAELSGVAKAHKPAYNKVRNAYQNAMKAAAAGDPKKVARAFGTYRESVERLAEKMGKTVAWPQITMDSAQAHLADMQKVVDFHMAVSSVRAAMPDTLADLSKMRSGRAEELAAALDKVMSDTNPATAAARQALDDALGALSEGAGLKAEGSGAARFRQVWANSKKLADAAAVPKVTGPTTKEAAAPAAAVEEATEAAIEETAEEGAKAKPTFIGKMKNAMVNATIRKGIRTVAPSTGSIAHAGLVTAVLGFKALAMEAGMRAATRVLANAGSAATLRYVAPKGWGLHRGIDGREDPEGSLREAYKRRSAEIRELAPVARNRAFIGVQGFVAEGHTDFAVAAYEYAVKAAEALARRLPKEPPGMRWGVEHMWEIPEEQLVTFNQEYAAITQPADFLSWAADNIEEVMPTAMLAYAELHPNEYARFRAQVLTTLAEEGTEATPSEQLTALGILLQSPLNPLMQPEFMGPQQQMYLTPPPPPPEPKTGGAAPTSTEATQAQQQQP